MTTVKPGGRLRAYMEARYLEIGLGPRHGWITDMERRTGVGRGTMNGWFTKSSLPRLDALAAIASKLQVSRADLVAAFDGTARPTPRPPAVVSDPARRRRRKWWLRIARETVPMGLEDAREALAQAGWRSERGNLVSLWEDPNSAREPTDVQLRALATMYRIPLDHFIGLWNNPDATDEETMAGLRVVPLELVGDQAESAPERQDTRKRRSA